MTSNFDPPPGIYSRIASKYRRALRNDTGARLDYIEIVALLHSDVWPIITEAERQEMIAAHQERYPPIDSSSQQPKSEEEITAGQLPNTAVAVARKARRKRRKQP